MYPWCSISPSPWCKLGIAFVWSDKQMQAIEESIAERNEAIRAIAARAHVAADKAVTEMRLLRYGGSALHTIIPEGVYSEAEVPDIDAFTAKGGSSKKTAYELANSMRRSGIEGIRIVPALHKSTHSVRIGRQVVADLTLISPSDCELLREAAKREGLPCKCTVPTLFLKLSMHMELSRPAVFIERWRKIWPRLVALYREYPRALARPLAVEPMRLELLPLCDEVLKLALSSGCVIVGRLAVRELTGKDILAAWPHDFVLPKWPEDDEQDESPIAAIDGICSGMEGLERSKKPLASGLLGPPYYMLTKQREYMARVFVVDTEVCTARATFGTLGTSDLVLHLLYSEILRAKSHTSERQALADAIDAVTASQAADQGRVCQGVGVHRRFTPFNVRKRQSYDF